MCRNDSLTACHRGSEVLLHAPNIVMRCKFSVVPLEHFIKLIPDYLRSHYCGVIKNLIISKPQLVVHEVQIFWKHVLFFECARAASCVTRSRPLSRGATHWSTSLWAWCQPRLCNCYILLASTIWASALPWTPESRVLLGQEQDQRDS